MHPSMLFQLGISSIWTLTNHFTVGLLYGLVGGTPDMVCGDSFAFHALATRWRRMGGAIFILFYGGKKNGTRSEESG